MLSLKKLVVAIRKPVGSSLSVQNWSMMNALLSFLLHQDFQGLVKLPTLKLLPSHDVGL